MHHFNTEARLILISGGKCEGTGKGLQGNGRMRMSTDKGKHSDRMEDERKEPRQVKKQSK